MEVQDAFEKLADTDLMLRVQWGSEYAFAELYRRYLGKLHRFFYGMVRGVSATHDAALADDLCHETFLRIWQLRTRYVPNGSFPAYFFRVARNIWYEHQRAAHRDWKVGNAVQEAQFTAREESPGLRKKTPAMAKLRNGLARYWPNCLKSSGWRLCCVPLMGCLWMKLRLLWIAL